MSKSEKELVSSLVDEGSTSDIVLLPLQNGTDDSTPPPLPPLAATDPRHTATTVAPDPRRHEESEHSLGEPEFERPLRRSSSAVRDTKVALHSDVERTSTLRLR